MPHQDRPQPESERVLIKALIERPEAFPRPIRKRVLWRLQHGVNTALTVDMVPVVASALGGVLSEPVDAAVSGYIEDSLRNPPDLDLSDVTSGEKSLEQALAVPPEDE